MQVIDHVSITVRDLRRAMRFYDAIMATLGVEKVYERSDAVGYGRRNRSDDDQHTYFSIYLSAAATPDARRHYCFRAKSGTAVREFYSAGLKCGGTDAGPPGVRAHYHSDYYAAFLEDPDGNRVEAVYHGKQSLPPQER